MSEPASSETTADIDQESSRKPATPLRCFVASAISGGIAFSLYLLLTSIVQTYANKPVTSTNPAVINLTVAVRTMVIGIAALGTGVFGLVGVGLSLLGIQIIVKNLRQRIKSEDV